MTRQKKLGHSPFFQRRAENFAVRRIRSLGPSKMHTTVIVNADAFQRSAQSIEHLSKKVPEVFICCCCAVVNVSSC